VSGDAIIRKSLFEHVGPARLALFLLGAILLAGYGTFLNLAPLEFGQVVGLYIATLFVMWQIVNFLFFRALPTVPILMGGALIVVGGLVVSFWKAA
jgi:small multidrug resistance family-3 protein